MSSGSGRNLRGLGGGVARAPQRRLPQVPGADVRLARGHVAAGAQPQGRGRRGAAVRGRAVAGGPPEGPGAPLRGRHSEQAAGADGGALLYRRVGGGCWRTRTSRLVHKWGGS